MPACGCSGDLRQRKVIGAILSGLSPGIFLFRRVAEWIFETHLKRWGAFFNAERAGCCALACAGRTRTASAGHRESKIRSCRTAGEPVVGLACGRTCKKH